MTAKEQILKSIKHERRASVTLETFDFSLSESSVLSEFKEALQMLHAHVKEIAAKEEAYTYLGPEFQNGVVYDALVAPDRAAPVDVSFSLVEARLGVAENGAIWVDTTSISQHHVAAIFTCEHLVLLLKKENVVSTLHEAYRQLPMTGFGYGVFIAGPSKTADIEQSLVIGAHGPKALTVFLY